MIRETKAAYRDRIQGLCIAYARVFDKENEFTSAVLKDLARFCRANVSTFHPDPRMHAVLEGRREVYLKIQELLNSTVDEIIENHKVMEIKDKE